MLKSLLNARKTFSLLSDFKKQVTPEDKKRIKRRLLEHLGEERGLWLKAIQLLEGNNADWDLQEIERGELPALPFEVIAAVLEENYGENWADLFQSIDEGAKTASFSQVHKAVLKSGEQVALKIQYPFIEEKLEEQLSLLKLSNILDFAGPTKKWGVDIEAFRNYLTHSLHEELDYQNEALNLAKMGKITRDLSWVVVPRIIPQLSKPKILAMSWEEGEGISTVATQWSQAKRQELANKIFRAYFHALFHLGSIQSDPNDGNFLYRTKQGEVELVWLDFGALHNFTPQLRKALAGILKLDTNEIEHADLLPVFVDLGFDENKLKQIESCLPAITLILFEGIKSSKPFSFSSWELKTKLNRALGEYKWWFRSAGGIDFFALMKSFLVVKNHLAQLNVPIIPLPLINEVLEDVPSAPISRKISKSIPLDERFIRVLVVENGIEKVQLAIPLTALWDLPDLMDGDLLIKLQQQDIQINDIIHQATTEGLPSKTLFELAESGKHTKVWID